MAIRRNDIPSWDATAALWAIKGRTVAQSIAQSAHWFVLRPALRDKQTTAFLYIISCFVLIIVFHYIVIFIKQESMR